MVKLIWDNDNSPLFAPLSKLFNFIIKIAERRFYGKITLSFESGQIVNIKQEETIKL